MLVFLSSYFFVKGEILKKNLQKHGLYFQHSAKYLISSGNNTPPASCHPSAEGNLAGGFQQNDERTDTFLGGCFKKKNMDCTFSFLLNTLLLAETTPRQQAATPLLRGI
jgi:hypothetical protein